MSRLQQVRITGIAKSLFTFSKTYMARSMQWYAFGSLILAVSESRTCLHSAPSGVPVASMRIGDTADRKTLDLGADGVHRYTGRSGAIYYCRIVMSCHARSCSASASQLRQLPSLKPVSINVAGKPQVLRGCAAGQQTNRLWRYTAQHGRLIARVSKADFSARPDTIASLIWT